MPYIDRDKEGNIRGIYACKQREGQEYLEDDNQELIDHLTKQEVDREELQATESLIQAKIREQAITALVAEGKLDAGGKITVEGSKIMK